jgi:hypothetical protein
MTRFYVIAAMLSGLFAPAVAEAQVDILGAWVRSGQENYNGDASVGDYSGLPINEAAHVRADSWTAERWGVPERQCEPHPSDYAPIGPANMRIWSDVDPRSQEVVAYHMVLHWMMMHRVIWMDGRPHPPEWAPHTWDGFSTGKWDGDTLTITTTHLKTAWVRRNGLPRSDKATTREHWFRHGNTLSAVFVTDDPIYLTEPLIRTFSWELDLGFQIGPYPCDISIEVEHPEGHVPYYLPGANPYLTEFAQKTGIPQQAARGGAVTTRPEYARTIKTLPTLPAEPPRRRPAAAAAGAGAGARQ